MEKIEKDAEKIEDRELKIKIDRAMDRAGTILDAIAEDPKDMRLARKFLVVYLDGVKQVCEKYLAVDASQIDDTTHARLYTLLDEVQTRFDKELERLRANDRFDLDVQIDALREQIKN